MHPLPPSRAEEIGLAALAWLAGQEERMGAFLGATGADVSDLRERAGDPEFLGFLLDFILAEDAAVIELAGTLSCPPEDIQRARAGLPGGQLPNWT